MVFEAQILSSLISHLKSSPLKQPPLEGAAAGDAPNLNMKFAGGASLSNVNEASNLNDSNDGNKVSLPKDILGLSNAGKNKSSSKVDNSSNLNSINKLSSPGVVDNSSNMNSGNKIPSSNWNEITCSEMDNLANLNICSGVNNLNDSKASNKTSNVNVNESNLIVFDPLSNLNNKVDNPLVGGRLAAMMDYDVLEFGTVLLYTCRNSCYRGVPVLETAIMQPER